MSLALETRPAVNNERNIKPAACAIQSRAIVIGGSMTGFAAARVLSDHYREVILDERDHLDETPGYRCGVPQGRHTHGLLASGRTIWESFLPGFFEDVLNAGAAWVFCVATVHRTVYWRSNMLKRRRIALVVLVVAALFAIGAMVETTSAQKAAVPKPQNKLELGEDGVKELLLLMDTDKNGKISKQEFMKFMEAEFERLDKNKNGELDAKELTKSTLRANYPSPFALVGK